MGNKYIPYIFGLLLSVAIVVLYVTAKKNRKLDEHITLRRQDRIPYGTYVAYKNLKYLFPDASISTNKYEPGYWDSLSNYDSKQALIIVCDLFSADEDEMKKMITFAESGNDVFVSARNISYDVKKMITDGKSEEDLVHYFGDSYMSDLSDSLTIALTDPPYKGGYAEYIYPGRKYCGFFTDIDTSTTEIFGKNEGGQPNFIHLRAGKGNFYFHLAPLAFSNYFILHKKNIDYYEKALSVIQPDVTKVVWDEYYLYKRINENREQKKSWLTVLFRYPALKAALLTAFLTLLVYVLLEMRRKQRYIPVITKPRNDSLDFVKTIGRMYYDKGDHKNLCRKMGAYFLEHIRNRYKLPTGTLDEEFIKNLRFKSGAGEEEIRGIVSFIKYLDDAPVINNSQLTGFHKQLESFYKNA